MSECLRECAREQASEWVNKWLSELYKNKRVTEPAQTKQRTKGRKDGVNA